MKIEILGTSCKKCEQLHRSVVQIVKEAGIQAEVEKVSDMTRIISYSVMSLPALVVDGKVKAKGRVPDFEELKALLGV